MESMKAYERLTGERPIDPMAQAPHSCPIWQSLCETRVGAQPELFSLASWEIVSPWGTASFNLLAILGWALPGFYYLFVLASAYFLAVVQNYFSQACIMGCAPYAVTDLLYECMCELGLGCLVVLLPVCCLRLGMSHFCHATLRS